MPKIGLLSDTHGHLEPSIFEYFNSCDEIWHAGDIGSLEVSEKLSSFKPLRAVHGNIDDYNIRLIYPEDLIFTVDKLTVWMTHIGGNPGNYPSRVKKKLREFTPDLFVCGHSHILRVVTDISHKNMLYMNPGAAGNEGFHKIKTLLRFEINERKIHSIQAIELGKRGR
ncbi:MAG: metallophosphatase family protein [Cytophagaceae bacterium]|nr:metallophosphatase family protein [Cytophagaceae bacterium]MDW8457404.1 metallophosphoesterase family protein [Cytophagaceae bacterium]